MPAQTADEENDDHRAEASGVCPLHSWTNAGDVPDGRIYVDVENTGETAVTLTGGTVGDANGSGAAISLRADTLVGHSAETEALPGLPVGPGGEAVPSPGEVFCRPTTCLRAPRAMCST